MNKMKRYLSALLALAFVIAGLTACSNSESGTSETTTGENSGKEVVELHLADMSVYGIAIFNYAEEIGLLDGYFDDLDYEVHVELSEWASGVDQNAAFAADEIDFSSMGNLPAVTGSANGYGTKILAVNLMYENDYVFVVRTDSGIETAEDMKGKNVGTYVGTVSHFAVAKYLEAAGLTVDDVNLLNVAAETTTSLRNGDIDVAVLGNIQAHQLEEEGTVKILSDDQVPIYNYIVGREEFANQYPEITKRVLQLINETWDYVMEHQDDYTEFYADRSGTDVEIVKASFEIDFPDRHATDFDDEDYRLYIEFTDWMKSIEYLAEDVDPDSLLDRSFIKELSQ